MASDFFARYLADINEQAENMYQLLVRKRECYRTLESRKSYAVGTKDE